MMKKKLFALIAVVLCICLWTFAIAEEPGTLLSDIDLQIQEQLFEQVRPILELTVAASILPGETAEEFDAGDPMPSDFAASIISLCPKYGIDLQQDPKAFLESNYSLNVQDEGRPVALQNDQYVGLFLLDLSPSPDGQQVAVTGEVYMAPKAYDELSADDWNDLVWADMMATMTLQKDESALTGWKVSSLHYSSAYFSDDTDEPQVMVPQFSSYYNEKYGCSVSYPFIFSEDLIQSSEDGMSCSLPDGTASIEIRFSRTDELTCDAAAQAVLASHPDVVMLSTEMDDIISLEYHDGQMITRWFCTQTDQAVITVSLTWDRNAHADFSSLSDIMMQSLISEEDSLG